ncbi:sigma-70 family RNA polymerase sigma factor, partial [Streptomyces albipurpureus]
PGQEPDLVVRARSGDRVAFASLYNEYHDEVARFVASRVSGNQHLVEDLTSETFLRALRRIDTFAWQGRDFGAWLATIARNLMADHFRSSTHRLVVTVDEIPSLQSTPSAEDSVLRTLEMEEARALVSSALSGLTAHQRDCLMLRFVEELSVKDTAAALGVRPSAAKNLQFRASRSMRAAVAA